MEMYINVCMDEWMDSCSRQTNVKWIITSEIQNYKQNTDIRYLVLHLNRCIDMHMYLIVQDNNI